MYNNSYMPNYNPNLMQQNLNDKIDNEIAKLQQMKNHNISQPAINQTFQLAPNSNGIKFVNDIEDVQKEFVISDTPFFSKDMSVVWIKNTKGEIKTYELNEIIAKDDKDLMIESLQMQIAELRKEVKENAKSINTNDDEPSQSKKSSSISNARTSKKE